VATGRPNQSAAAPAPRGRIRAAQREFTRTRLVEAGIEVFAEKGFAHATIDEVAERAGTTRTTFYLHFRSKTDMVHDLLERTHAHFEAVYNDLTPVAADPTYEGVRRCLVRIMDKWKGIADVARAAYEASILDPDIHELLITRRNAQTLDLARAIRDGAPALEQRDAEVYAAILLAPLAEYFERYLRRDRFDRRRVTDVMAAAWMAVLSLARTPEEIGSDK
jgi:AcrR family transcriptional regulator